MKINKILLLFCLCLAFACSKKGDSPSTSSNKIPTESGAFEKYLPEDFQKPADETGKRILKDYGAVFVARGGAIAPKTAIFKDETAVSAFQSSLKISTEKIGAFNVELQTPAMDALKEAIAEAKQTNQTITPRANDSSKRTYRETVELWASRVEPGLKHWVSKGKLTQTEADKIKNLSPFEQVPEIFRLEAQGIYFSKDLSKSIVFSVSPPGTSQHLSLLALDINEHENKKVREILAKHGWFQTIISDLPHFTYLGAKEAELPNLGLIKSENGDRVYWIPKM